MVDEIKKARIGGIKISAELVRVDCAVTDTSHFLPELCELLTEHQINMHFLTVNNDRDNSFISFCLAPEDVHRLTQAIVDRPELDNSVVYHPRAGLLSIFPAQADLNVLGLCLESFDRTGLKLYGISSSLSALTFVIDYDRLDEAITTLRQVFELPAYHTPFKPEIRIKQSPVVKED